ncbi:MAG: hypothetical protein POELPBGB_00383 [Bacteroidia bacterium]|nr:hypothetical protein [Bacteroidia bacterium]
MQKSIRYILSLMLIVSSVTSYATPKEANGGVPCYELTETVAVCRTTSYTFPDGYTQVINSQTVHTSNLLTVVTQCDSIITTTVNVLPTYFQEQSFFGICPGDVYTFPDGTVQTIFEHTEYESHFQTVENLCDSVILTVLNTTDLTTAVSVSGNVITAQQGNAGYQWVDCDNNYAIIPGQLNQSYSAPSGNFAVIIYKGSCTDTSACVAIGTVGIAHSTAAAVHVYPNPANGVYKIDLGKTYTEINLTIRTVTGQLIQAQTLRNMNLFALELQAADGVYIMELQSPEGLQAVHRLVKKH